MDGKICNKCGRETNFNNCPDIQDLLKESNKFHNFSTKILKENTFNSEEIRFVLCNKCLNGLIKAFAVPIK